MTDLCRRVLCGLTCVWLVLAGSAIVRAELAGVSGCESSSTSAADEFFVLKDTIVVVGEVVGVRVVNDGPKSTRGAASILSQVTVATRECLAGDCPSVFEVRSFGAIYEQGGRTVMQSADTGIQGQPLLGGVRLLMMVAPARVSVDGIAYSREELGHEWLFMGEAWALPAGSVVAPDLQLLNYDTPTVVPSEQSIESDEPHGPEEGGFAPSYLATELTYADGVSALLSHRDAILVRAGDE